MQKKRNDPEHQNPAKVRTIMRAECANRCKSDKRTRLHIRENKC